MRTHIRFPALVAWTLFAGTAPNLLAETARAAELPFEKIAQDFLAAHGLAKTSPDEVSIEEVLKKHFVHGRLGLFEISFPVAGLEKRAADLKDCAVALLDAQAHWLDWLKPAGPDQKLMREDFKLVSTWVKSWRVQALQRASEPGGKDWNEILLAPEKVALAGKRLSESLGRCAALGAPREEALEVRLVLLPTRKEFVEMSSFAGLKVVELRESYWSAAMPGWSQCYIDDLQVIALEYPSASGLESEWGKGVGMNEDDPTLLQQQVVQLSMNSLLERHFAGRAPALFLQGLSMNLVIDQFGLISTRVDGDMRSRSASAREVFVPGVADDGFLPKNSAEGRWREDKGRDRFLRLLRLAQREGEGLDKKLKNKLAGFAVRSDKGGDLAPVAAPFLGSAAAGSKPPAAEFQGDFAEMIRGYKCAFIWWLQNKSATAEKAAREGFAKLLIRLSDPKLEGEFEAVFPEVYEAAPLSGPEAGKDTLEGRFLIWLSKQK